MGKSVKNPNSHIVVFQVNLITICWFSHSFCSQGHTVHLSLPIAYHDNKLSVSQHQGLGSTLEHGHVACQASTSHSWFCSWMNYSYGHHSVPAAIFSSPPCAHAPNAPKRAGCLLHPQGACLVITVGLPCSKGEVFAVLLLKRKGTARTALSTPKHYVCCDFKSQDLL